jgi:DNA-binding GntR family transcriptional regulator
MAGRYGILYPKTSSPRLNMSPQNPGRRGPLPRITVADAVANALRDRILSHELAEGVQLRQESLAAELGVSRIPLREALQRLEAEGLVTIVPHRGAVVSAPSLEEISELFDLRAMIESDLIRRAVPRISAEDLGKAKQILREYKIALDRRDVAAWGELNTAFHLALYSSSKRTRSLNLAQQLLDQTDRYTRMQLLLTDGQSRAQREHEALLQACGAGEADAAAKLLLSHVTAAGHDLFRFLAKRVTSSPNNGSLVQADGLVNGKAAAVTAPGQRVRGGATTRKTARRPVEVSSFQRKTK